MSRMCDKSVFVIFRPININYCHSRGCYLEYNLHSVFSQRPCSPDTYFALQYYSRLHYFALYFACFLSLKRIGSLVNEDDDFHNLIYQCLYLTPHPCVRRAHSRGVRGPRSAARRPACRRGRGRRPPRPAGSGRSSRRRASGD